MQLITYFLSVFIIFLGSIIGMIIAIISEEELKQGKKYFILLQKILLFLMIHLLLFFFNINTLLIFIISILFIIALYFLKIENWNFIIYNLLALIIYLTYSDKNYFIYLSTLIFIYGIPLGSLFIEKYKKKRNLFLIKKFLLSYIWFFLLALLPFALFNL